MNRFLLLLVYLFIIFFGKSQDVYYYKQSGDKIILNENKLKKYLQINANVSERSKQILLKDIAYYSNLDTLDANLFLCSVCSDYQTEFDSLILFYSKDIKYCSSELSSSQYPDLIQWTTNEIFVEMKPCFLLEDVIAELGVHFNQIRQLHKDCSEYLICVEKPIDVIDIANRLFNSAKVVYAQPSFIRRNTIQNPYYQNQWALHNTGQYYSDTTNFLYDINIIPAWEITKGDSSITIALLDEGVKLEHEDLQNNLLQGKDEFGNKPDGSAASNSTHGTRCAGIIVAEDNSFGIVGVAPKSKLFSIRIGSVSETSITSCVEAFCYLLDSTDIGIASFSFAWPDEDQALKNAIDRYVKNARNGLGGVVACSAGNYNCEVLFPASGCNDNVISVGACIPNGERKKPFQCDGIDWGSCYGNKLDVMAPGIAIYTTNSDNNNPYTLFGGTSAACPHVAGIAALILSQNPNLPSKRVKEIIERSCTKVRQDIYSYDSLAPHGAWDYEMGYGLVNAYQAVLMAQGCKDYPYCTIDTIRGNASWNSPITVGDTLVIDSLSILTISDTVAFYSEGLIIVRPGGKLIVNGGTLTNACEGEMWEGIIVEGNRSLPQYAQRQGSVILNNATVENARNAISTHGADTNAVYEHTGGIVQATNTLFRNNRRAAEFLEYENHSGSNVTDNTSRFTRCTFTVDDDNLFASNGTSFLEHVSMWRVRGVKFNGCTFQNQDTTHSYVNRGRALYTADAGYRCRRICPVVSDTDPCACQPSGSQPVVRCSFTGFYKAIESTGDCGQGSIVIDNCDFANNFVGIALNASDNAQVSYNHFNLDFSQERNSGLRLVGSTGFTVEDNDFVRMLTTQDTIYGIICDNTGNAENFIRRNDFSNLFYGCYSLKNNGPIANRPRGLQFNCNSYTANTYDIYVPANSTIRNVQGSSNKGADNDFSNTLTRSLTIPMTMNTLSYYYSSGNSHIPVGTSNYTGYGTATANPCASTLCGLQNPSFPPGIIRYASLSEEYEQLSDEFERRGYGAILSDRGHYTDSEVQDAMVAESRLDSLSVEMAELSNRGIKAVIQDSVMDFSQLKDWFGAVNTLSAKYLLVEAHYLTGDYAAANRLLSALPDMFDMSEGEQEEYGNYRAFHALRNALAGNTLQSGGVSARRTWAELTEPELAELQRIAEGTQGRTATMAQGILCFFYRICYEEDNVFGDAGTEFFTPRSLWESQPATESSALHVYPNPAGSVLHIESGSSLREVTAYDPTGRIVLRQSISGTSQTLDISQLQNGIYLLRVVTASGVETGRFVKN